MIADEVTLSDITGERFYCPSCHGVKTSQNTYPSKHTKDGFAVYCTVCERIKNKASRDKHAAKKRRSNSSPFATVYH